MCRSFHQEEKVEVLSRDKNCLSHWFPKLMEAALPVPSTIILRTYCDFHPLFDNQVPDGWEQFIDTLLESVKVMGTPCFLRTGQGSGKHQWKDTCYIANADRRNLEQHVFNLVEWSECVDFMGLPTDVWVVRQMLDVAPVTILPRYGNMPLVREARFFVKDGVVLCGHGYWPERAVAEGMVGRKGGYDAFDGSWKQEGVPVEEVKHFTRLAGLPEQNSRDWNRLWDLARQVAAIFRGYWSVDILFDAAGALWVTDMAVGQQSFHWPDCPYQVK
jgi:hypothetical protein